MAGSRVFVQEGIYDEFVKKIALSSKEWVVGDPFDPRVNQGPQVAILEVFCLPLYFDKYVVSCCS